VFKEDVGQTFSDIWYRVGQTRPRLSPHAQVVRQYYGPSISFIVEDPASGQYYRLSESAYFFLGLLDGRRTADEAWNACNAQLGDAAPTQRECVELLSKLQMFGLLLGELPLAADMVLERKAMAHSARVRKRTGMWMFFTIPLWNPEPFLERYSYIIRAVFSRWGAAVWGAVVLVALVLVGLRWRDLASPFNSLSNLDPTDIASMGLLFLVLRALHEIGHAAACKAMGGRSTEIGVILVAGILPLPYCDATSAWRMPETWKRVVVSAAGMIFETFAAAIAAIVWALTPEGGRVHALCFTTMVVSGVTTVVFNANPLLRYDGYYILSDITGTPNLTQRSRELWVFLIERYVFGLRGTRPPRVRDAAEARLMLVFGALSIPYRVFVGLVILTVLANKYLTLGVLLAAVMGMLWVVWPVLKGLSYVMGSPRLVGRRARAAGIVAGAVAAAAMVLGLVPMPAAGYASGTVEPARLGTLRAGEDGFVTGVLKSEGDEVEAGEAVVLMENPELAWGEAEAEAQLDGALARLDLVMVRSPQDVELARVEVETARAKLARVREQMARLVVRAPVSGRIATAPGAPIGMANIEGRFVPRGGLIASVVSDRELVVRALVSDRDHAYIFGGDRGALRVSLRVRGDAGREVRAAVSRVAPAGSRDLTSQALSTASGGDILTTPGSGERAPKALTPGFVVEVTPDEPMAGAQPGLRAGVRFGVEPEPLLWQWWRKGRQFFSARLGS
jgi:putative peptide zinc metalloprotease protein